MLFYTQSAFVFHHHHGYIRLSVGLRYPLSVVWDLHTHQFGETQGGEYDSLLHWPWVTTTSKYIRRKI